MTSLGFSIFSRYEGDGISRARRDIDSFNTSITGSTRNLNSWSGRLILAAKAAAVFGPALLPIAAHLTAIAGAATAMATSVGAALGAYGAAMKGAITKTLEMAEAGKKLAPSQKAFVQSVDGMKSAWQRFITATQDKTLATATHAVKGLTAGISLLKPILDAIHPSVLKVSQDFEKWMKGDSARNYANLIKASAVPALQNLVAAGKDVLNVLGDGFRAFLPNAVGLSKSLRDGAAAMRQWSDSGGFQRFLTYVRENDGPVREFFRALGDAFKTIGAAMRELGPLSLGITTTILKLVAALPPEWIANIVKGFIAWKAAMLALAIISTITTMVHALAGAWFILNLAFSSSVIGLVIIAIMALIAGIILLVKNWDTVSSALKTAWNATWNALKTAVEVVWNALKTAWQAVVNFFKAVWDKIGGPLKAAWDAVWSGMMTAWNAFKDPIMQAWNTLWPELKRVFDSFSSGLSGTWSTVWSGIKAVWDVFVAVFGPVFSALWQTLTAVAKVAWAGLQLAWQVLWTVIQAAWEVFVAVFVPVFKALWTGIVAVAKAVWDVLVAAWNVLWAVITAVFMTLFAIFTGRWGAAWNAIKDAAVAIWELIKAAWNVVVTFFVAVWNTVSAGLTAAWNLVWNAIKGTAENIWNGMKLAWDTFINALQSIWSTVSGALSSAWSAVWNAIKTAAEAVWSALKTAWEAFINGVKSIWDTISSALRSAWDAFWNAIKAAAEAVWNFLKTAWQTFMTAIQTAYTVFSTALKASWNILWNAIKLVAQTVWTWLQTAWQTFVNAIRNIYNIFSQAIQDSWNKLWSFVKQVAETAWNWIQDKWQAFVNKIREIYNTFSQALQDSWDKLWNFLKETASKLWHEIGEVIEKAINSVINLINGLIKGFNNITKFLSIDISIDPIGAVNFNFAEGGMVGLTPYMNGGISEFAKGGVVNLKGGGTLGGYAPGRDTVPAMLSRGEGVLVPEAVRGLGGPGFVHSANHHFSAGRAPSKGAPSFNRFDSMAGGQIGQLEHAEHQFAKGGMVGGVQHFAVGGMTAAALARAGVSLGMISQGEYSDGSLSAGTHLGGGVVDIASTSSALVAALRAAGFAAWARGPADGMSPHIHAVLMNHPDLSPAAQAQVASFLAGGNGLGVGGGGGGGGIDIMGMLAPHIGKILLNVYRGTSALAGIGGTIAALFGGGDSGGGSSTDSASEQSDRAALIAKAEKGDKDAIRKLAEGASEATLDRDSIIVQPTPYTGRPNPLIAGSSAAAKKSGGTGAGTMLDMLAQFVLPSLTRDHIATGLGDATKALGGFSGGGGGMGKIAVGVGKKLIDEVVPDYLMKKAAEATPPTMSLGGGGAGVQQWAALAAQALALAGLPASQLGAFLALMQAESGGNPAAINLTDVNARAGTPSQGLMQVIPGTFAAYRDPSLSGNILDPLANMVAAANYIQARYNGVVPGSPYAHGTDDATPGMHLVGEQGPELVTSPGYAMFGGGEQVFTAGQTSAMMAPPVAVPTAPASGGSGVGGGGAGNPMELIMQMMQASEAMSQVVASSWGDVNSSTKAGFGGLQSAHNALIAQVGGAIPDAFVSMATSSRTNWTAMATQTAASWAAMRDGVYTEAQLTQSAKMPLANTAMSDSNMLTWQKMNIDSAAQWGLMRDLTFTEAGDFISVRMPTWGEQMNQGVSTSFQNMTLATAESWGGMEDATRAPVNWIISNAYNNGLARLWNAVAAVIFADGAQSLPSVSTLAKGGPVRGPGTGTSDSVPAMLSSGEHVWTAAEVRKAGGHQAVANMRSMILSGNPVQGASGGPGFANGGWLAGSDSVSGSVSAPALGELKRGMMSDVVGPSLDALDAGTRSALGGNAFRKMGAVSGELSPSNWMREYIKKDDELNRGGEGAEWARAQIGKAYVLGSFGSTFDCSTYMSGIATTIRDGVAAPWFTTHPFHGGPQSPLPGWERNLDAPFQIGVTAAGIGHMGGTVDGENFEATPPAVRGGASARGADHSMYQWKYGFSPSGGSGTGIQSPGGGTQVDPADLTQGITAFDRGGWWKPGTLGYNGTGRPELAIPADDLEQIANDIRSVRSDGHGDCGGITVNFNGPTTKEAVQQAENSLVPKLRSMMQQGVGARRGGC